MKKILLATWLLMASTSLWSIPAKPGFRAIEQPNGEKIQLEKRGDETFSYYMTPDGYPVVRGNDGYFYFAQQNAEGALTTSKFIAEEEGKRRPAAKAYLKSLDPQEMLQKSMTHGREARFITAEKTRNSPSYPSQGRVKGLVILVEFADKHFVTPNTNGEFNKMINNLNHTEKGRTGSVRDYFRDQSGGKFDPTFDVIGPVKVTKKMRDYGANNWRGKDIDAAQLVVDACKLADNQVNFSNYDINKDGILDLVYIIYAGYGEAQTDDPNTIWPHAWHLPSAGKRLTLDNTRIEDYACSSELAGGSGNRMDGIGTLCHEFSHCLGLPDLYDTSGHNYNFGMGKWDIMDAGSYNNNSNTPAGYSAYERMAIGWLTPEELTSAGRKKLPAVDSSNKAYIIYNEKNRNEYFIFENRQPNKWDQHLPSHGLLISHIDYNSQAWLKNTVNAVEGHPRVTIKPADNELVVSDWSNYQKYITSQTTDIYPGRTQNKTFTNTSRPAAKFNTNNFTNKPITDISLESGIIYFNFINGGLDTSISDTETNDFYCYSKDGSLHIKGEAGLPIQIFNTTGACILSLPMESDHVQFSLPKGIYIIRSRGVNHKVIL